MPCVFRDSCNEKVTRNHYELLCKTKNFMFHPLWVLGTIIVGRLEVKSLARKIDKD